MAAAATAAFGFYISLQIQKPFIAVLIYKFSFP